MLLDGKVVIVTGAGGGIGEGIARVCDREGAHVVVADVNGKNADAVVATLAQNALAVSCDVSQDAALERLTNRTLERFGRIDGLVNNAGINCLKPALETTADDWQRVMAVNLRSAFVLTQLVCRQMLKQHPSGGCVVNIASVHTHAALPACLTYEATKWGMIGLTKSMAIELASQGIRINAVSPGLVATQIWEDVKNAAPSHSACEDYLFSNIPIARPITPVEIGEVVAFLLCERSRCIVGANLFADGGMSSQLLSRPSFEFKPING